MRIVQISSFLLFWLLSVPLPGQRPPNTDCETAQVICSDSTISFAPLGPGKDDFLNPNNDEGCLAERERISAWYYFEFRRDMPPNYVIEFTLKPLGGGNTDYDFAIYGPDLACDSLGSPVRCSFADPNNVMIAGDTTGLRPYVLRRNPFGQVIDTIRQTETSEGRINDPFGRAADGFVAPMVVQPGQGFYLLLDFFQRDFIDSIDVLQFELTWGGTAAPYLNCIANPRCVDAFAEAGPDTLVCAGDAGFALRGGAFNTNGGESYRWSGSGNATSFLSDPTALRPQVRIPAGFSGDIRYSLTIEEGSCVKGDSVLLMVQAGPEPVISGDTLICVGASTNLTTQPGFDSYRWSDGSDGPTLRVDRAGTYRVSVTNGSGCPGVGSITVREYPVPRPIISGTAGFCPGGSTTLQVSDAFTAYRWSNGGTSRTISVADPGMYRVTVTTADGCEALDSLAVVRYDEPRPAIAGPAFFCEDGSATLDVGAGYREYRWDGGQTTAAIAVDASGTYAVTVTDDNGCTGSASREVTETPNPRPAISGDALFCSGLSSRLDAAGPFRSYRWSTGDTTAAIEARQPGEYQVEVTDERGCAGLARFAVDTLPSPRPAISGPATVCSGDSIVLRVDATFAGYSWSTGSLTPAITVRNGGVYRLTVTAANGCPGVDSTAVTRFTSPQPVIDGPEAFCEGGVATLDAGAGYREYRWSTGPGAQRIEVNLPGSYAVTVTDDNGCQGRAVAGLREQPRPRPLILGDTIFCNSSSSRLSADRNYARYEWSTGDTLADIEVFRPGTYRLTVYDAFNCPGEALARVDTLPVPRPLIGGPRSLCRGDSILLDVGAGYASYRWSTGGSQPTLLVRTGGRYVVTVTNDVGCSASRIANIQAFEPRRPELDGRYGLCTGEDITLRAGAGFREYRWTDGSGADTLTISQGGSYTVTVTDDNGCRAVGEAVVDEFSIVEPDIRGPDQFCSGQNVSLFVEGPYVDLRWSTGARTPTISINRGGTYTVTVTDGNGCSTSRAKTLREDPSPVINIKGDTLFCEGASTELSVEAGLGAYLWTNGRNTTSVTVTEPGLYGVQVRAANGCTTTDQVNVRQAPAPRPLLLPNAVFCPDDVATLDAGPGFRSYLWSDGSTGQTIQVSTPGVYSVSVTDARQCAGSAQTILRQLPGPRPEIASRQTFCAGSTATLRADSNFVGFRWSTGDTTLTITVQQPGDYRVTVVDDSGCEAAKHITLTEVAAPVFTVSGDPFFCAGGSTTLAVEELFAGYRWSDGGTRRSVTVGRPGAYAVTVTNAEGCSTRQAVDVREIPLPRADAGPPRAIDCRAPVVRLGGPGTTTGAGLAYRWTGPGIDKENDGQLTPGVGQGGRYILQVIDTVHQCPSTPDTVLVDDSRFTPQALVRVTDTLDCLTDSVLVDASASDRGGTLIYRWMNGNGQPVPSADPMRLLVRQPGLFTFTVEDTATGCAGSARATVAADRRAPRTDAGPDRQLDCRDAQAQLNATATETGPGIRFRWSTAGGNITSNAATLLPVVDQPGVYRLEVTNDRNGCSAVDSVRVIRNITAPLADAGADQELDCDLPEVTLDASGSAQGERIRLSWNLQEDPAFRAAGVRTPADRPGTYILLVTDEGNGCTARDTVAVTRNEDVPRAVALQARRTTCFGDADGRIRIDSVSGGAGPFVFRLGAGPFVSTNTFDNLAAGQYELTVQDLNGCELAVPVTVAPGNDIGLYVGEDRTINLGDTVTLQALVNIPADEIGSFRWESPPGDTNLIIRVGPVETTSYGAVVVDTNGCRARDFLTIIVKKERTVYIPNAFSPNNDGNNDFFMIFSGDDVLRINYLRIFNRWGEMLFEQNDFFPNNPAFGWDGWHRGRLLNAQVFAYVAEIEFKDGEREIFKGDVTLVR